MPVILYIILFICIISFVWAMIDVLKEKEPKHNWAAFARLAEMIEKSDEEMRQKYMNKELDIDEILDELDSSDNIPCDEYGEWIRGLVELNNRVTDCASEEFKEAYKKELRATYEHFKEVVEPDEIEVSQSYDTYESLKAFKEYVHKRLDEAGIPEDPDPVRTQFTGCRIGVRLDQILNK